jgi:hypothetical protein
MPRERLLAGGMLVAVLGLATAALAQTHGARPARPGPKPKSSTANDSPSEDRAAGSPLVAAATPVPAAAAAPVDAGPVAPPPAESLDGGKLSPLTPAANEFSDASLPPASVDYDRLLADIAALRARVASVTDTLFHSRIAISLETSGEHSPIANVSVSIDDGVVWTSPAAFRAEDATVVYDHAVAPGHHAVTVDIERRDGKDDTFRSAQRSRFVVDVPNDERLGLEVKLWDDSTMGDFRSDKRGQYELRVRARAKAQPLGR